MAYPLFPLFGQSDSSMLPLILVALVLVVFLIAAMWKVNTKAGYPGWAAIVPIYNVIVLCWIAGKSGWMILINFIPFIGGLLFGFLVYIDLAKNFGKGTGFGIGLVFLPFIFFPILAFGEAEYQGTRGDEY